MTRAVERELAALARSLPRFVTEDDAAIVFRLDPRSIRRMVVRGDLVRGVAGTVTRVSILANLAARQGLDLDSLDYVLDVLDEEPAPVANLAVLTGGVVGNIGGSQSTDQEV